MVGGPRGELEKILRNPDDPEQETRFQTLFAEEEREMENPIRLKENELLEDMEFLFPIIAANS